MAKKYYEMYEEIKNLKPKTAKYFRAVSKMFNIEIDTKGLQQIRALRKNDMYKKGKTFSQAVADYNAGVKYENKIKQRTIDIWEGKYLENITNTYSENYLKALERNNIDSDIINFLRSNPEIIKMGAMPNIKEFYIPSRGKGKKYSLNIENSEIWNQELREFLEEAWDMPKKIK